jgi:hypothetical protein
LFVISNWVGAQLIEFGAGIGITNYSGDLSPGYKLSTAKPAASVHYRLNFSEIVSTRFTLTYGGIKGDDSNPVDVLGENRNHSFSSNILEISSVFEYHFLDYKDRKSPQKWSPYAFLGFGMMKLKNPSNVSDDYRLNQMVIPMGLGFKHKIGKQFVAEFEAGARKTFFDYLDGISDGDVTIKDYQFGNPNDDDWYFFTGFRLSFVLYKIPCPFPYIPNRTLYQRVKSR